jgi:hypothetical protein
MISLPEQISVLEDRLVDSSNVFPIRPISPVLAKVPRITEHVGAISTMCERITVARKSERRIRVVIVFSEYHDVVGGSFAEKEMVDSLHIIIRYVLKRNEGSIRTFVLFVPSAEGGLLTVIVRTPSGTFVRVPNHAKVEDATPERVDVFWDCTAPQWGFVMVGTPPLPEDDMLKEMLLVTPWQFIAVLNSNEISMVVALTSLGLANIRASWPGTNLVMYGGGAVHWSIGTNALKLNGAMVTEGKQPIQGALLLLAADDKESCNV